MGEKKAESHGTDVKWEPPRGRRWCEDDGRAGLEAARASGKRLNTFALKRRGIRCSMSRKGDCWDNAVAESFFATLKREMEDIDTLDGWVDANLSIGEYIDGFYNTKRRHSALNYSSPIKFELMHSVKKAA